MIKLFRLSAAIIPLAAMLLPAPAHATGGLSCKTAGPERIVIDLGFGHVPSASLFAARLSEKGKEIAVDATQWWMQGEEVRLAMVHKKTGENALLLKAQWSEKTLSYDGALSFAGRSHWVRCREA